MEDLGKNVSPPKVEAEQIADIRLAASKMHGAEKRSFQAEMVVKYGNGNARQGESTFGWSRCAIETGLGERRTGIVCLGAQAANSGRALWEETEPEAAEALRQLAEAHSQQDPTFKSTIAYTRLTAKEAIKRLVEQGFRLDQMPSESTMADGLNRMDYRLRRVVKAKPVKKIKETDAIFDNIAQKEQQHEGSTVKRVSMDMKATVNIGDFSRGGSTRGDNRACDHDMTCDEKYTPCGIVDEETGQLHITFGSSYKTSDFLVDTFTEWWHSLDPQERLSTQLIQLKLDNGPENSGVRTQFLNRMVALVDAIGVPIQLLYYPPYHSKYNLIERCWGILELHWNGAKLIDVDTMLQWATSMTWKGLHPTIQLNKKIYHKGISLAKQAMKNIERRLTRNPLLPKWDILIQPA